MKTYEVEFRLTSFVTYTVKANGISEAEFIAYQELAQDGYTQGRDVMTESLEEITGESK
jgi:hypothetical protein